MYIICNLNIADVSPDIMMYKTRLSIRSLFSSTRALAKLLIMKTDASGHRSQLEERDLQWHERGDLAEVRRCDGQAGVEATFQNDRHLQLTVHDPNL